MKDLVAAIDGKSIIVKKLMNIFGEEGASTTKWTTLDPCLVLIESKSILCTNFEFCEEKKS